MSGPVVGDGGVVVTYTVHGAATPTITTTTTTTTTIPLARPAPQPNVTHHPLPLTGAPVAIEMTASFGLLLAGALAAFMARRRTDN